MVQGNEKKTEEILNKKNQVLKERSKTSSIRIPAVAAELLKLKNYGHYYNDWKGSGYREVENLFRSGVIKKPSEMFTHGYEGLLEVFVPKQYRNAYLYIIDKMNQFQYPVGWYRRSVRTESYVPWVEPVLIELYRYADLFLYDTDIKGILSGEFVDEDLLPYCVSNTLDALDNILAAELDLGNEGVKEVLREILMGENNTARVTTAMIRGIVKSDDEEMHRLLGDFLLAARLQEGVRQAVCENMDCGTPKAFMTLFEVIEKNNLIRYSSIRRAVCTWIGIFKEGSVERLTDKMVSLMGRCLREPEFLEEQLKSEDAVSISCGLWAKGFFDSDQCIRAIEYLLNNGSRNQKMTASYYNDSLLLGSFKQRAAKKVLLEYDGDLELLACYFPAFLPDLYSDLKELLGTEAYWSQDIKKPVRVPVTKFFKSREEAEACYEKLKEIHGQLPKKGISISPCIFPWHEVALKGSDVAARLCFIAYLLQDEKKLDEVCGLIGTLSYSRYVFAKILLYDPQNSYQRKCLLSLLSNGETYTSQVAYKLVDRLSLTDEEYLLVEGIMKSKRPEIRARAENILMKQDQQAVLKTVKRLMSSSKEELRSGGLDIVMELKKQPESQIIKQAKELTAAITNPTGKEKVMIEEILGEDLKSSEILNTRGYGLYDPDFIMKFEEPEPDRKKVADILSMKEDQIIHILKKLDRLVGENSRKEYRAMNGEVQLIGNELLSINPSSYYPQELKDLPLCEVWEEFYHQEIGSFEVLIQISTYLKGSYNSDDYKQSIKTVKEVYGRGPLRTAPYEYKVLDLTYEKQIRTIFDIFSSSFYDKKKAFSMGIELLKALVCVLGKYSEKKRFINGLIHKSRVSTIAVFANIMKGIEYWETDEEFKEAFFLKWNLEELYVTGDKKPRYQYFQYLRPFWFLKACSLGLIDKKVLYYALFENYDFYKVLLGISYSMAPVEERTEALWKIREFYGEFKNREELEKRQSYQFAKEIYWEIIPIILQVELKRGEPETVFSPYIKGIGCVYGTDILVQILMALGSDTLDRNGYYDYYYSQGALTKKSSMSHLLSVSYPLCGEDKNTLKAALKETDIKEKRLIEVAMYAPQWIDILEEYLGWKGMKCGCYYFMAHMNESFDDRKKAVIAKYTPLDEKKLQDGAFDLNWFREAYESLGQKHFKAIYDAAKYISDSSKHSRARKYADAALGEVNKEELLAQITAKRNKDSLMSYGIIPLEKEKEEEDLLNRYQYFQQFLKESKQFGAQRRASEARAVEIAMENLSINAGYQDVMRLTLRMETRLAESFQSYFDWNQVKDCQVRIFVDDTGKPALQCQKDGKLLKSVPAKLKKEEITVSMQQAVKGLKEQHSRTRQMMEQAMEERTGFQAEEISLLYKNPVIKPVMFHLVYASGGHLGFLRDGRLVDYDGTEREVSDGSILYVAHPVDFYQAKSWHEYQKYLFEHEIRQPFKQVFRELYVKTEEELLKEHSLAFAGNQIQPQKTVGCLRGRRWIADYESGLQKVYYKDNIIACIYAMADWFSPADIEAPTLEWVEFTDRKTFEPLKLKDIPDIIYSEVMRDVDLAVSVAHAGGVDPETSHSTVEMRKAIIEFNLPLFKLSNVRLQENHAFIKGSRGEYTVNLGSGVIHQSGGAMIHILPVHSQRRGKLFLPFVDEDPKTAEIMSKIVLLSEDSKIKDPYILDQIH